MGARGKKKGWWVAAAAVLTVAVVIMLSGRDKTPVVETALPSRGSITRTCSAYGRIRPVKQVNISPDVSGEITDIFFEEGDTVKKGDLLLKIKQESYLMAIARSEAALGSAVNACEAQRGETTLAGIEYERLQELYKSDATCLAQLQQAQIKYETSLARTKECECRIAAEEASLSAARSELRKTLVYSPMDGIVSSLLVKPGERVVGTNTMAGTQMMTIADLDQMELVVDIGENDINNIREGCRARIMPDASPSDTLEGRVERIAVSSSAGRNFDSSTDFEVRISIENQHDIKLLPGMSASVLIYTGSKNDILTVPLQAVTIKDGRETVWTVDAQSRVHLASVRCGLQDFNSVEITQGLQGGERIVTGPYQMLATMLKEGDKVKTE